MFRMMGVFAEFERALIRERVLSGLEITRSKGKRLGRPPVPKRIEHAVRKARAKGLGIRKIATELGIGTGTVQRLVAD